MTNEKREPARSTEPAPNNKMDGPISIFGGHGTATDAEKQAPSGAATMSHNDTRDLGHKLIAAGLHVFPIKLKRRLDGTIDKAPATPHGHLDATDDPALFTEQVNTMRLRTGEQPGVGVHPGPSRHLVVDVDVKNGAQGNESLALIENTHGPLPARRVKTASGGFHLWMKHPPGVEIGQPKLWSGIDIRSGKGWIVAPGTWCPWGKWEPVSGDIGDAPASLVAQLTTAVPGSVKEPIGDVVLPGDRHASLLRVGGAMRRQGADEPEIYAALAAMNEQRCQPPKPDGDVRALAADIAKRYSPNPDQPATLNTVDETPLAGNLILDQPEQVPAVWGRDDKVLWSEGEGLLIVGPPGVGKSTLANRLAFARLGIGPKDILGYPVTPSNLRIGYFAMDRPSQILRSMRRMVTEEHRAFLNDTLVIHRGPPPFNVVNKPEALAEWCEENEVGCLVLDSLKDVVPGLAKDEVGAAVNTALQHVLAAGVEVVALHHQRKSQGDNRKPKTLDDVYGSTWITAGAGSVILLWGSAGDPLVELGHLKQPAADCGPIEVLIDPAGGVLTATEALDAHELLRLAPDGLTARGCAERLYGGAPSKAQIVKARRQLDALVSRGLARAITGPGRHDSATVWMWK